MSRLFNIAACLVVMASVACGEFTHPFVAEGEVYTNTMMLDLLYGRWERWSPSEVLDSPFTTNLTPTLYETFNVFYGYTNVTTTNIVGEFTVTNVLYYPVYTNSTRSNDFCFLPWEEFGYTNVPHVTRDMIAGDNGFHGTIDDFGYFNPPWDDDHESGEYWTRDYSMFWLEEGVNFSNYFAQLDSYTNFPINIPMLRDPANILVYTNIGYVTNAIVDGFGVITTGSNEDVLDNPLRFAVDRFADWYYTRSPPTTQNWNLAECFSVQDLIATNFVLGAGDGSYTWDSVDGRWEGGDGGEYDIHSVFTNGARRFVLGQETGGGFDEDYFIGNIGSSNWLALPYVSDLGFTNNTDSIVSFDDTTTLAYREQVPLDYNHFDEDQYPALIFTSGGNTNPLGSVMITLTGNVFGVTGTNGNPALIKPFNSFSLQQQITNASEDVWLSTNRFVLSNRWQQVTDIICDDTSIPAGHTWSVVYDTETTLYGDLDWSLTATDLNERRSFLDCLRWPVFQDALTNNGATVGSTLWSGYTWDTLTETAVSDGEQYPAAYVYTMDATNTYFLTITGTQYMPEITGSFSNNPPTGLLGVYTGWTNWNDESFAEWDIAYIGDLEATWSINNFNTNGILYPTNDITFSLTFGGFTTNAVRALSTGGSLDITLGLDGFDELKGANTNAIQQMLLSVQSSASPEAYVLGSEKSTVDVDWTLTIDDEAEMIVACRRTGGIGQSEVDRWWSNAVFNVESSKEVYGLTGQPFPTVGEIALMPSTAKTEITNSFIHWEVDALAPSNIHDPSEDTISPEWQRMSYLTDYAASYGPKVYTGGIVSKTAVPYGSGRTTRGWSLTDAEWLYKFDATVNGFQFIRN